MSIAAVTAFCSTYNQSNDLVGKVNKDGINVRIDSVVTAPLLGQLHKDEAIQVVEEKFEWYKITLPKRFTCYAYSKFLEKINTKKARVTATVLRLRNQPFLDSHVIGKVKKGDILNTIEEKGEWTAVEAFPHTQGWIHKKFVDIVPSPSPEPTDKEDIEKQEITNIKVGDTFTLKGILSALSSLQNCDATYKLKSGYATFFLKIGDIKNVEELINKKVTIEGTRNHNGCTYIDVKHIYIDK